MPAAPGTKLTIRLPDDFHHHARDGPKTATILQHVCPRFGRCLMMPNLKPPVTTTEMALAYKQHILASMPEGQSFPHFQPVMVLDSKAAAQGIAGCKYYPAGATTNSDHGVTDIRKCYPALQEMSDQGMMLCIHSEVTHGDIFEREPIFIEEVMKPLVRDFPKLKITMEHISTKEAVDYVLSAPDNVKASITCHHLLFNRNHLLVGGIRPHLYCLPILKGEVHRQALIVAATSGSPRFFLGTDSAPHAMYNKETACGCAGVYTAHAAVEFYAEVFDSVDALDKLEDFCSSFGADHYGLPRSTATLTLVKQPQDVPITFDFGPGSKVVPLRSGEQVQWSIVSE